MARINHFTKRRLDTSFFESSMIFRQLKSLNPWRPFFLVRPKDFGSFWAIDRGKISTQSGCCQPQRVAPWFRRGARSHGGILGSWLIVAYIDSFETSFFKMTCWIPNLQVTGWWQLKYVFFTPDPWGNDPIFDLYFSNGLKPPSTSSYYWGANELVSIKYIHVLCQILFTFDIHPGSRMWSV